MKVLTIKEPWASLIINGYKGYEFRGWKTNYRGKILISTSKVIEKEVLDRFACYNICYNPGYIIGEANLEDCILVDEKFNKKLKKINSRVYAGSNHTEKYAWKLNDIKKYENPIPCKGKLGLWNYEEEVMLHLDDKPFNSIKNGTKTIEMRLNDEKRRKLKVNDIIEFENRKTKEIIKAKIIKLYIFKNFEELYNNFDKF